MLKIWRMGCSEFLCKLSEEVCWRNPEMKWTLALNRRPWSWQIFRCPQCRTEWEPINGWNISGSVDNSSLPCVFSKYFQKHPSRMGCSEFLCKLCKARDMLPNCAWQHDVPAIVPYQAKTLDCYLVCLLMLNLLETAMWFCFLTF